MSLDRQNLTSFQSVRRILLSVLTVFILFKLISSIIGTFDRPQIQGKFELYQTDLVLIASEWTKADSEGLNALKTGIVGADILKSATQQYQNVRSSDETAIDNLNRSLADLASADSNANTKESLALQTNLINKTITAAKLEIDRIDLRIGILQAANNQPQQAIATWHQIITTSQQSSPKNLAAALIGIWNQPAEIDRSQAPQIAAEINTSFKGWFRDRTLDRLYADLDDRDALAQLDNTVQTAGKDALIKLALITVPRAIIGFGGVILIVFFSVRIIILAIQQRAEKSLPQIVLANIATPWTTPWDWEIVWQVFMVGFFFVGQFLLPTLFSAIINPATLTTRGQGLYVFSSYVLMSGLGVGVLYLSIKSYFPLPPDWFKFNWKSNWILWGIGGYLVANPIVIIVSLLNEKIWHGQGGSNPLLQIVLEGKDSTALWLFFGTAAVAAPLFEEFLFRGFLLPSLTRYVPVWAAIGISGLIFGVAHLSLSEILPLTSLGIILGIVYVRTRNLLAPMLLHSLWNSSTLVSLFILGNGR